MVSPISVCQDRTSPRSPGLSLHSGSEGSDVPPHSGSKGPDRTLPSRSLPPSSTQCHLRPNPYKLSPDAGSEGPVEMFPYRTVPRPLNPTWCSPIPWFATMLRHQAVLRQRCPLRPPVQHDAPQSPWITTTSHHQASPATCPPVCDPLPNCSPAPLDHRDAPPPNGSYHMFPSPPDGPHHVFPGPANLYDLIDHIFPDRPHCPPAPLGHRDAPPPNGSYHMFPSPAHGPHHMFPSPADLYGLIDHNFPDRPQHLTTTLSPQHPLPNSQASDRRMSPPSVNIHIISQTQKRVRKAITWTRNLPQCPCILVETGTASPTYVWIRSLSKPRSLVDSLTLNFLVIHQRNTMN